jgi:hypothetical protein
MQQEAIKEFIEYVDEHINICYIEVETNGTIQPSAYLSKRIDQWNCSPKLANSGNSKYLYYNENVILYLNKLNTIFKFVLTTTNDWNEIVDHAKNNRSFDYDKKLKKFYEIEKNLSNLWNEKISPPISSYPVFNIVDAVNKNEFYALALDSLSNGYTIYDYSNFTLANYNFITKKLNTFKINRDSILIPEKLNFVIPKEL